MQIHKGWTRKPEPPTKPEPPSPTKPLPPPRTCNACGRGSTYQTGSCARYSSTQRRERIAAGKPIPDTVTMTNRFFEVSMLQASRRCLQCHNEFAPHGKESTCKECRERRAA